MDLSAPMQAALETGSISPRWILALAVNGGTQRIAFWTGDRFREIVLDEFDGMGTWDCYPNVILAMSDPQFAAGLDVLTQRFTLWAGTQEAVDAIRSYDLSLVRAEVHLALMDEQKIIGTTLAFQGYVDSAPIDEAAGTVELTIVSDVQDGVGKAGLRKSDASLRLRNPEDTGNAYADVAGSVKVIWGIAHDGQHVVSRPG